MAESDIRAAIAAERQELADLLSGLPEEQWDAATLCAGWRIRETVAHMTMPFRYGMGRLAVEMVKARGNFDRMADRCARHDAASLTAGELATSLRDNVDHPWKPPGSGFDAALSHDVIHSLDITVGLGLDRRVPEDRLRTVLGGVTPKTMKYFGVDLDGVELRATDIDWSLGSGAPMYGVAQDLLLVLSNRRLPPGRLVGERSGAFTAAPPSL